MKVLQRAEHVCREYREMLGSPPLSQRYPIFDLSGKFFRQAENQKSGFILVCHRRFSATQIFLVGTVKNQVKYFQW